MKEPQILQKSIDRFEIGTQIHKESELIAEVRMSLRHLSAQCKTEETHAMKLALHKLADDLFASSNTLHGLYSQMNSFVLSPVKVRKKRK